MNDDTAEALVAALKELHKECGDKPRPTSAFWSQTSELHDAVMDYLREWCRCDGCALEKHPDHPCMACGAD